MRIAGSSQWLLIVCDTVADSSLRSQKTGFWDAIDRVVAVRAFWNLSEPGFYHQLVDLDDVAVWSPAR